MKRLKTQQIDSAIGALCPEIWANVRTLKRAESSEIRLWEELVCCVLSSQVKFELSQAVTKNLALQGLLDIKRLDLHFEDRLRECLRSTVVVDGRFIKYRFPNTKAKQIAGAWENIYGNGASLRATLDKFSEPLELRDELVKLVPGLGMKQASMYLRNVSNSFELAVIDSHVIKYMKLMNLVEKSPSSISKSQYLVKEASLTKYVERFAYPVGVVDYAIWIVMRVASRNGYL